MVNACATWKHSKTNSTTNISTAIHGLQFKEKTWQAVRENTNAMVWGLAWSSKVLP